MSSVSTLYTCFGCFSVTSHPACGRSARQFHFVPVIVLAVLCLVHPSVAQVAVNTTAQGVTNGQCSLQEAIYATEFADHVALDQTFPDDTYYTGCADPSGNWNTIVLPGGTLSFDHFWDGDGHNPFGPTATPIIFSNITIEGKGTTLNWVGSGNSRLFAVGFASITPTSGVATGNPYSGTGSLVLRNVYVQGFHVQGGAGGAGGGGGGLGAGGAIYVGKIAGSGTPSLTIENSTFANNGAVGGQGGNTFADSGGGGGLGGNGGNGNSAGGGGGGSRGNGASSASLDTSFCSPDNCFDGGGGGGTVSSANGIAHGNPCGGDGGDSGSGEITSHIDGYSGTCPGGGGGGGAQNSFRLLDSYGSGGTGAYGGGGGGGINNGGQGGFGGGGGAGGGGGGNGGFGGGGGAGLNDPLVFSSPGKGGPFGGNANDLSGGGGGGALGGAIFNDSGTVVIENTTLFNNYVTRGASGGGTADNGADAGGAIFSRNGSLTVQNATISGNQATGSGAGIVVMNDGTTPLFILQNTIVANKGAQECMTNGAVFMTGSIGNLILSNSGCVGVAVTDDPGLEPLALNKPGNTPTMALPSGSSAIGAADVNSSLPTDQRGIQRKPNPDIGAFESVPLADLSLSKTVSTTTAKAGDAITYTLTLTNNGPDAADTVSLTDSFPTALTFVSCVASGVGSCTTQGAAVVATYSSMPSGDAEKITIKGTLNSGFPRGTMVTNSASVQASSPEDSDTSNNSASASFAVIVPDFSVSASSPITIAVSGSGTSSVSVSSIDGFSSAVTLKASGPSGFKESFSFNPVTPSGGGSKSSTLTVILEPSVTAGSYNVTVAGTSGTLTHSAVVNVIVKTTLAGMANMITADQSLGCIDNSGIGTAMTSKLTVAQNALNTGEVQVETNTLQALLNQLYAQAGKHIATSCVDGTGQTFNPDAALVTSVNDLLTSAGAVLVDPITGTVVNGSGTGVAGVTVNLLNSSKNIVATATTDISGFYYFPGTGNLVPGAVYTAKVNVPKIYKGATPFSQGFTWKAVGVALLNFILN